MRQHFAVLGSLILIAATFAALVRHTASAEMASPSTPETKATECAGCQLELSGDSGPYACPIIPIMSVIFGTIYYADYYDPDCEAEPQAAYLIGNYAYPAECPDCVNSLRTSRVDFPGMREALTLSSHSIQEGAQWSIGSAMRSVTKACGSLGSEYRPEFAGFLRLSETTQPRYAIVISLELGLMSRGGRDNVRYVAFEVTDLPDGVSAAEAIAAEQLPGGNCYRANYELRNGQQVPVLVLLARST